MKSMAVPRGDKSGVVQAEEMLRYAMSLPVTTTICGMDSLDVLTRTCAWCAAFSR